MPNIIKTIKLQGIWRENSNLAFAANFATDDGNQNNARYINGCKQLGKEVDKVVVKY